MPKHKNSAAAKAAHIKLGKSVSKQPALPKKAAAKHLRGENARAIRLAAAEALCEEDSGAYAAEPRAALRGRKPRPDALPRKRKSAEKCGSRAAVLPPVAVLDIIDRDAGGILLARPHNAARNYGRQREQAAKPPHISAAEGEDTAQSEECAALPLVALPFGGKGAGIGTRVLAKLFPAKGEDKQIAPYQGRIIRILEKQTEAVLGIIRKTANGAFRLEPAERRRPELWLDADALCGAQEGDLALVEPYGGASRHGSGAGARFGRVKQRISRADSEKALSAIALYMHNIPTHFPAEAVAEAQFEAKRAGKAPLAGAAEDWREISFITIDPESAKDHDDAVFAEADSNPRNKGGHIIRIAIADVAAYVRPDSALDKEARRRGNSVYLPDRAVPMLPEEISNNLCSLREGEERRALAAQITLSGKGRILRHSFHRILMRSRAKLSYSQAQAALDGQADAKTAPLLAPVLQPLMRAYTALKAARDKRQPLELNLPERRLILDESGHVCDIRAVPRLDSHRLIEEFMIAANSAAAETLKAKNKPLLFRVHGSPAPAKQESLREFLRGIGIKLGSGAEVSSENLNAILAKAAGEDYEELVNQLVLRAQAQAEYSTENIGHFGLKLPNYAHFTSPIRRYADLLLHRSLIKALNLGAGGITAEQEAELESIAAEISAAERRAMRAERETHDRLIAHYLSNAVGAQFHGRINGVTRAGLFITLDKTGADGLAPIASLKAKNGGGYYHFDEAHFALVEERSSKGFQLGDRVEVRLTDIQKTAGSLRFELLSPPKKMPFSAASFHKATHSRRPPAAFKGNRR